jgi:hypothetical protein
MNKILTRFGGLTRIVTVMCILLSSYAAQAQTLGFDDTLAIYVRAMNKSYPRQLDAMTRMDSVSTFPGRVFQYNYTITTNTKEEIDTNVFRTAIAPGLLTTARDNPGMDFFRETNMTLVYSYNDKNGAFLWKYVIVPAMYKKE